MSEIQEYTRVAKLASGVAPEQVNKIGFTGKKLFAELPVPRTGKGPLPMKALLIPAAMQAPGYYHMYKGLQAREKKNKAEDYKQMSKANAYMGAGSAAGAYWSHRSGMKGFSGKGLTMAKALGAAAAMNGTISGVKAYQYHQEKKKGKSKTAAKVDIPKYSGSASGSRRSVLAAVAGEGAGLYFGVKAQQARDKGDEKGMYKNRALGHTSAAAGDSVYLASAVKNSKGWGKGITARKLLGGAIAAQLGMGAYNAYKYKNTKPKRKS